MKREKRDALILSKMGMGDHTQTVAVASYLQVYTHGLLAQLIQGDRHYEDHIQSDTRGRYGRELIIDKKSAFLQASASS